MFDIPAENAGCPISDRVALAPFTDWDTVMLLVPMITALT
jgi:hypothetical protein